MPKARKSSKNKVKSMQNISMGKFPIRKSYMSTWWCHHFRSAFWVLLCLEIPLDMMTLYICKPSAIHISIYYFRSALLNTSVPGPEEAGLSTSGNTCQWKIFANHLATICKPSANHQSTICWSFVAVIHKLSNVMIKEMTENSM